MGCSASSPQAAEDGAVNGDRMESLVPSPRAVESSTPSATHARCENQTYPSANQTESQHPLRGRIAVDIGDDGVPHIPAHGEDISTPASPGQFQARPPLSRASSMESGGSFLRRKVSPKTPQRPSGSPSLRFPEHYVQVPNSRTRAESGSTVDCRSNSHGEHHVSPSNSEGVPAAMADDLREVQKQRDMLKAMQRETQLWAFTTPRQSQHQQPPASAAQRHRRDSSPQEAAALPALSMPLPTATPAMIRSASLRHDGHQSRLFVGADASPPIARPNPPPPHVCGSTRPDATTPEYHVGTLPPNIPRYGPLVSLDGPSDYCDVVDTTTSRRTSLSFSYGADGVLAADEDGPFSQVYGERTSSATQGGRGAGVLGGSAVLNNSADMNSGSGVQRQQANSISLMPPNDSPRRSLEQREEEDVPRPNPQQDVPATECAAASEWTAQPTNAASPFLPLLSHVQRSASGVLSPVELSSDATPKHIHRSSSPPRTASSSNTSRRPRRGTPPLGSPMHQLDPHMAQRVEHFSTAGRGKKVFTSFMPLGIEHQN